MRQNYIPNSEIISITGHNSEAGHDVYDSGNEELQHVISNAIDTVNKDPVHFQRSHSKPWVILPNDEWVKNLTFNFLDQKWASNLQIITSITALLIFTMARILLNTKIIMENIKDVWYIPLILLTNNNFLIFCCVEYCVCCWLFVRLCCYKNVKFKHWKWIWLSI